MHPESIPAEILVVKNKMLFQRMDDVPLHMYTVVAVTADNRTLETTLYFDEGKQPDNVVGKIYNIPFMG